MRAPVLSHVLVPVRILGVSVLGEAELHLQWYEVFLWH